MMQQVFRKTSRQVLQLRFTRFRHRALARSQIVWTLDVPDLFLHRPHIYKKPPGSPLYKLYIATYTRLQVNGNLPKDACSSRYGPSVSLRLSTVL